jgi:hypothetical protein
MSDDIKGKNRRGFDWKTPVGIIMFGATLVTGTIAIMEGQVVKAINTQLLEFRTEYNTDSKVMDRRVSGLEVNYAVFAVQLPDKIDNLTKLFEKHISRNE